MIVVALAAKCVEGLAKGLRSKFSPYSPMITSAILEKFKEKKMNVVLALRDAIDSVFFTVRFLPNFKMLDLVAVFVWGI